MNLIDKIPTADSTVTTSIKYNNLLCYDFAFGIEVTNYEVAKIKVTKFIKLIQGITRSENK